MADARAYSRIARNRQSGPPLFLVVQRDNARTGELRAPNLSQGSRGRVDVRWRLLRESAEVSPSLPQQRTNGSPPYRGAEVTAGPRSRRRPSDALSEVDQTGSSGQRRFAHDGRD
jgi:hypothetical protein